MRTRTLLLLAVTSTVVAVVGFGAGAGGFASPEEPPAVRHIAAVSSPGSRAAQVLRAWDHERALAWAHGDASSLAALYAPGSRTGRRDVTELRRWQRRGLRVEGQLEQVAEVRVLHERTRRLVLRVTDRTVDAVAVGTHRRTALPRSAWRRHRIRLVRRHGRWLVEEAVVQPAR